MKTSVAQILVGSQIPPFRRHYVNKIPSHFDLAAVQNILDVEECENKIRHRRRKFFLTRGKTDPAPDLGTLMPKAMRFGVIPNFKN